MIKIYVIGLVILFGAIVLNIIAAKLELMSWYDLLQQLPVKGNNVFTIMRIWDYLWLFIGYPFLLGCCGYAAEMMIKYWWGK